MKSTGGLNEEYGGGWIESTGLDQEYGAESRVPGWIESTGLSQEHGAQEYG